MRGSQNYKLSKYRFNELKYFCLQYSDMDTENKRLIEECAREVDPDISDYIILGATNPDVTYNNLKMLKNIPCGKDMYYDRRKKFYSLLSKKKDNVNIA